MSQAQVYPYTSIHIAHVGSFHVGENSVTEFRVGQGQPGFLLVVIVFEEGTTDRRFMVSPTGVTFECGEPTLIEVPEQAAAPSILVPGR